MMEGKMRKYEHLRNKILESEKSPVKKNERAVSANLVTNLTKSKSTNKIKKLSVNVNQSLNGNNENLPQIGDIANSNSNNTSNPIIKKSNQRYSNQNKSKSPRSENSKSVLTKMRMANKILNPVLDNSNLIDQNLNLKNSVNKLNTEVALLKTEINKSKIEVQRKENLIEELLNLDKNNFGSSLAAPDKFKSKEFQIITNLKKQNSELKELLKSKEEEINTLKNFSKVTQANELLIENKTLNLELERIKSLYDNLLLSGIENENSSCEIAILRDNFTRQQNLINSLQERNQTLLEESNKKRHKIKKLQEKLKNCNNLNRLSDSKIEDIEEGRNSKANEISNMKNKLGQSAYQLSQEDYEQKIKIKKAKLKILKKNLIEKSQEIKNLIDKLNNISKENEKAISKELTDREQLIQKLDIKRKKYRNLKNEKKEQEELQKVRNLLKQGEVDGDNGISRKCAKSLQDRIFILSKEVIFYKDLSEQRGKVLNHMQAFVSKIENQALNNALERKELISQIENLQTHLKLNENNKFQTKLEDGLETCYFLQNKEMVQMTEDNFNEMTYVLIKNFEAYHIKWTIIEELFIINLDNNQNVEELALKIMKLFNNTNIKNKEELVLYLKYLIKDFGTNIETLKLHFSTLFDSITFYSNENSKILSKELKEILIQNKDLLKSEILKRDQNNSGYITFTDMRKILEQLNVDLDLNLVEYFIYLMKKNDDQVSSFRDLKYNNVLLLLEEDLLFTSENKKLGSELNSLNKLSSEKESHEKSQIILSKIADYILTRGIPIRKFLTPNITIEEGGARRYKAIYLKLFLTIIQNNLKITIDMPLAQFLFNRFKNYNNIYNLEVIDIDKFILEMKNFGIDEMEEDIFVGEGNNITNDNEIYGGEEIDQVNIENNEKLTKINNCKIEKLTRVEDEGNEINLVNEIKCYMIIYNVQFEKLIFTLHNKMIINPYTQERIIKLDLFLKYLINNNVIDSNRINQNLLHHFLDYFLDYEGYINIDALKKALENEKIDKEKIGKRVSKGFVDGIFSNSIAKLENDLTQQLIKSYEKEKISANAARRMTDEFFSDVLESNRSKFYLLELEVENMI